MSPCTTDEVSDVVKSLKNGKPSGAYSISIKLLKILDPHLSADLSTLIKDSFGSGDFSNRLRIAKVIPYIRRVSPQM